MTGEKNECQLCGAVSSGNITCPECRKRSMLSDDSKEKLRGVIVGYPMGTVVGSPHVAMIKSVNRHNRKVRKNGLMGKLN